MATVDEFVRTSILSYPTLFKNRTDVLHNALCVIGTGYQWGSDGTVVYRDGLEEGSVWTKEKALADLERYLEETISHPEVREMVRPALTEGIEEDAKVVAEVDARMYERSPIEHFYPDCKEYALLHAIPVNVSADWAEACEEMKVLAIEAGWIF